MNRTACESSSVFFYKVNPLQRDDPMIPWFPKVYKNISITIKTEKKMKEFWQNFTHFFSEYRERRKKEHEDADKAMVVRMFNVKESNGSLYVICDGVAVFKIEDNATAKEIVEIINNSRNAHLDYLK